MEVDGSMKTLASGLARMTSAPPLVDLAERRLIEIDSTGVKSYTNAHRKQSEKWCLTSRFDSVFQPCAN
jgi:hypothetical protein